MSVSFTLPLPLFVLLATVAGMLQVSSSDLSTALTSDVQYFKGTDSLAFAITWPVLFLHCKNMLRKNLNTVEIKHRAFKKQRLKFQKAAVMTLKCVSWATTDHSLYGLQFRLAKKGKNHTRNLFFPVRSNSSGWSAERTRVRPIVHF